MGRRSAPDTRPFLNLSQYTPNTHTWEGEGPALTAPPPGHDRKTPNAIPHPTTFPAAPVLQITQMFGAHEGGVWFAS